MPKTIRLNDDLDGLIRSMSDVSKRTGEVPELSQAKIVRMLLRDAVSRFLSPEVEGDLDPRAIEAEAPEEISPDVLRDLIPTHKLARYHYDDVKDEGWYPKMKGTWEKRVRDELENLFGAGVEPELIGEAMQSYIEEARRFWVWIEGDEETFERKVDYLDAKLEEYARKYEVTTFDPDEEFLERFGGVEDGKQRERSDLDEIVGIAKERIRNGREIPALRDALANQYSVDEELAAEAIETAIDELDDDEIPPATRPTSPPDQVMTDGGVDQGPPPEPPDDPGPGQEGYWTALEDGGEIDVDRETVRDRIADELDAEEIHGLSITRRDDTTVYVVAASTMERFGGRVLDLRTVVVDLDDEAVRVSDNGIWVPFDLDVVRSVTSVLARASNDISGGLGDSEDADPLLKSAVDGLEPEIVLERRLAPDDYEEDGSGWGTDYGNGQGAPPDIYELVERLEEADVETERFSRLDFGAKTPWERYGERPADELLGNYGVETLEDDPLVIVDVDDPDAAPLDDLPDTYAVSSPHGDERRAHLYYRVEDVEVLADHFGPVVKPGWGDVWISGEYVVGPGSVLDGCSKDGCTECEPPDRGRYRVVDDRPIEEISSDALIELLEPFVEIEDDEEDEDLDDEPEEPEPVIPEDPEPVECFECGTLVDHEDALLSDQGGRPEYVCSEGCR